MNATITERPETACRQECPACDGILSDAAITYGRWRRVVTADGIRRDRTITLTCPHCDHTESKTQCRIIVA